MNHQSMQGHRWLRGTALALALILPLNAGTLACSSAQDGNPSSESDLNTQVKPNDTVAQTSHALHMKISTKLQGTTYGVEFTGQSDGSLKGVRVITAADGTEQRESFEVPAEDLQSSDPSSSESSLPGSGDLKLKSSSQTATGTSYVYTTSAGDDVNVEIEGDTEYFPPAAAVLAALGVGTVIAVCGFLVYLSMRSCAKRDRCWEFAFLPVACWGKCVRC